MKIHTLSVHHRHGVNVTNHRTVEGAKDELLTYVSEWWTECRDGDKPMPKDADTAIAAYFNEHPQDEYYDLTEGHLND